jgi:cysteine-S-conjugate beta-lyase
MDFNSLSERRSRGSYKWKRYPEDVTPLWVADMDFPAADCIQSTLKKAIEHGIYGYSLPKKELIQTVTSMLAEKYNWQVRANAIVWLPGLVPALNICCRAFVQQKQKIVCSTPIYPPFLEAPEYAERKSVHVPLLNENGHYKMDFTELKNNITADAGLYMLCNPHNPVGRSYNKEELQQLAELCLKKKTVICSDEIHCDLILDKQSQHIPIASLSEEIANRTVTLMSPSKTWNLPGLGFAFAVIPNFKLRKKFLRVMRGIVPYPNQLGLLAGQTAYESGEPWRLELIEHLRKNQQLIDQFIKEKMPKIKCVPGEATYLAWLDVRKLNLQNPYEYFLEHGVALSDGKIFDSPGFLRLNFATTSDLILEGLNKLHKAYALLETNAS